MHEHEEIRPRNAQATRQSILCAARNQFMKDGYDHAGVRAIAAEAGIDPALICRYFGSKKQLFAEVLESVSNDPMQVIQGERSNCGERLAAALLDSELDPMRHMPFICLVTGAAASAEARETAYAQIEANFIRPFSQWLGGPEAEARAWMVCSLLIGAVILRNVQQNCPVDQNTLAERIQALVDGPPPGAESA